MSDPSSKAYPVSWDQFHRDSKALAWRLSNISEEKGEWKAIVSITRGGLVPAAIIARELGVRNIETVCIASYHEYKDQGNLIVLKSISQKIIDETNGRKVSTCSLQHNENATWYKMIKRRIIDFRK